MFDSNEPPSYNTADIEKIYKVIMEELTSIREAVSQIVPKSISSKSEKIFNEVKDELKRLGDNDVTAKKAINVVEQMKVIFENVRICVKKQLRKLSADIKSMTQCEEFSELATAKTSPTQNKEFLLTNKSETKTKKKRKKKERTKCICIEESEEGSIPF